MLKKISFIVWILISSYTVKYTIDLAPWRLKKIIDQDVIYYYGYLPATFIYHDWTFRFPDRPGFKGPFWTISLPDGGRVQKMTMGVAMLYSPFFGVAHLVTVLTGGEADGYSINYHIALIWAGVFYFILGLFFIRKILEPLIPESAVALVIISIGLGTNLFNYTTMDAAMSHVYSFFLFAFSLHLYAKWLQKQSVWLSVFLGLTTGLIVLIRPTNFTFVLMLMIHFLIKDRDHIKTFKFVIENWLKIFLIVVSAFLIVLPQLYYWKLNTGHWVFYSYQGENFFFDHPQIINGLFSYNKGWLIYTPVMWLAILGFFFMRKELSQWLIPSVITMLLSIYIIFSWWCWWYGGGFGARALVEFYVVMSLPLGAFFAWVLNKNIIYKFLTAFVLSFLLLLNLFQTKQYSTSLLHYDSMSKEVYWAIWNKDGWPQGYEKLLKPNDTEKAKKGESSFPY